MKKTIITLLLTSLNIFSSPALAQETNDGYSNQMTLGLRHINLVGRPDSGAFPITFMPEIKYARAINNQFSLGLGISSNLFWHNADIFGRYYFYELNDTHRFFSETSLGYNLLNFMAVSQATVLTQRFGYEYRQNQFVAQASLGGGLGYGRGTVSGGIQPVYTDAQVSFGWLF